MNARKKRKPRGGVLLLVVVCLSVMALVFGSLVKISVAERAGARSEERRLRAEWLAESGLERAWAKLADDKDYAGETWELSAAMLRGLDPGVVRIRVDSLAGKVGRRRVTAQADYPRDSGTRARQTRVIEINVPATASGDSR